MGQCVPIQFLSHSHLDGQGGLSQNHSHARLRREERGEGAQLGAATFAKVGGGVESKSDAQAEEHNGARDFPDGQIPLTLALNRSAKL